MGCGSSRAAESRVVSLCRERRELIRAAADRRYALASAHAAYFRALAAVGDSLERFVLEELAVAPSPMLTLPSDGKGTSKSVSSASDGGGGSSSVTPLSHSLSDDGSHLHLSSGSESKGGAGDGGGGGGGGGGVELSSSPPGSASAASSPSYSFMKSSTAIPTMVYEDPNTQQWQHPSNSGYGYGYEYGYGYGYPPYGVPIGSPVPGRENSYYYDQPMSPPVSVAEAPPTPPPPPPPEGSAWEFFDPFNTYEKLLPEYGGGRYGVTSYASSPDSSEVREKEGIPDLEDETEVEAMKKVGKEKKVAGEDSGAEELSYMLKSAQFTFLSKMVTPTEELSYMLKSAQFTFLSKMVTPIRELTNLTCACKLLKKVSFETVSSDCGKKVSFETVSSDCGKVRRITNVNITMFSLSQLHCLGQDEEKLQSIYNKKYKRLKALDHGGAEFYKIDSTRASIRKLRTKISIIIKSVDAISNRMHKIRDEELQPQLTELIQGLVKMWKSLLDCHQKQLQAIVDSKSQSLTAKTGSQTQSIAKATKELEVDLLHWCHCFKEWISTQKAYNEALNGWLMKWLPEELEQTPDGVAPFSPGRIGAPAVYIISNDWFHAIKSISEDKATETIRDFSVIAHKLWESQNKEQHLRLKAEYLSTDYDRRRKSLQQDSGMNERMDIVSVTENGEEHHDDRMTELDSMKQRLEEVKAEHEETVKQVQDAASNILQTGLIPIFEALETFSSQTLKAYEGLRLPNERGS
ncbi:hypothetical protein COCNU_scaffold011718G000070 [Cocos nucifera]|nr:hypothetical protein [Cocos nucifera]